MYYKVDIFTAYYTIYQVRTAVYILVRDLYFVYDSSIATGFAVGSNALG